MKYLCPFNAVLPTNVLINCLAVVSLGLFIMLKYHETSFKEYSYYSGRQNIYGSLNCISIINITLQIAGEIW
jgi:hypothetical protein